MICVYFCLSNTAINLRLWIFEKVQKQSVFIVADTFYWQTILQQERNNFLQNVCCKLFPSIYWATKETCLSFFLSRQTAARLFLIKNLWQIWSQWFFAKWYTPLNYFRIQLNLVSIFSFFFPHFFFVFKWFVFEQYTSAT